MTEIGPEALFDQVKQDVALLAAPADSQQAWVDRVRVQVDELCLQFLDSVPAFLPRLLETRMIDQPQADQLIRLRAVVDRFVDQATRSDASPEGLREATGWADIRLEAAEVLKALDGR